MAYTVDLTRENVYITLRYCALIDHVLNKNSPLLTASQIANLDRELAETEDFADAHIEHYAQQECRALCTAMQSKLPRELRDMIYDHILSPARDEPIFINNEYFEDVDEPYRDIVAGYAEERGYGYAHMCSEKFVDLDTMSEFARRWYYHTKLWLYLTPTEVAEFFETDIWGLGLGSDRLLRHLEVELCGTEYEDNVTPLQQCLFKLAPGASIVFHLRVDYIYGPGEYTYDEEFTMSLLSERLTASDWDLLTQKVYWEAARQHLQPHTLNYQSKHKMDSKIFQWERTVDSGTYLISSDRSLLPYTFVQEAYATDAMFWAKPLSFTDLSTMLDNSLTLGVYSVSDGVKKPIGMARFITDYTTLAYLTDVYLIPEHQGQGLGKWLIACCREICAGMENLRWMVLLTGGEQAQALYRKELGMTKLDGVEEGLVCMGARRAKLTEAAGAPPSA
ncbi:uncharacterized protein J4E87_009615 [Alternaria ethzedia]|uniref:uncharacterized protein n=1 Tax=Alternaria ethzedia TaxID=181014 RepID=UPI0020C330A9|nr:uncharacterized protein J4E87_009615 [Alternaria ethzedia]KAI4614218.1 hypothetical protein J4E87_009615 [Alternaria ethzedia]